jgi:hypothetical protein
VKHTPTTSFAIRCPPSLTPARLAVGLEAKKSSSVLQMRPVSCIKQNLWFPRVNAAAGDHFGNLFGLF